MKILGTVIVALGFVTVSFAANQYEVVRKAPDLTFNLPGEGQKTLKQYLGKVVALEFIWTTCPHCQAASRVMSKFQEEYGGQGFQAIDVAVNDNADLLVENFSKDYQVKFPVGWVRADTMVKFMGFDSDRYVVPQLVLIDRKGFIHYQSSQKEDEKWDAVMKEDTIRAHIEQLLGTTSSKGLSASARPRH